jgi:hypothetical protein
MNATQKELRDNSIEKNVVRLHLKQSEVLELIAQLAKHGSDDVDFQLSIRSTPHEGGRLAFINLNGFSGILTTATEQFVALKETP